MRSAAGQAPIHVVTAWATRNRLVLGQIKVADKSNEIPAFPALLALLDLRGTTVTIDAMGCQKTIARQKRAKRGIRSLVGRQLALQIIGAVGGIALARILTPAEFGVYAIATFLVGASSLLGDFGLARSFIQRKDEITERSSAPKLTRTVGTTRAMCRASSSA